MNEWVAATIAVVGGFVAGTILSRIVVAVMSRSKRTTVRESATPVAGLALAAGVVTGLLVALGFVSPDDLEDLGSGAIDFLPKAIAALVKQFEESQEDARKLGVSEQELRRAFKQRAEELLGFRTGPKPPTTLRQAERRLERQFERLREDAKELGISRSNLIKKCQNYGLGRREP